MNDDFFMIGNVPNVNPEDVLELNNEYQLIDVRGADEFTGELGHIKNAKLITLGPDLSSFLENSPKDSKLIFICRSGARSSNAALMAIENGISDVANLKGGMILWNDLDLPKE